MMINDTTVLDIPNIEIVQEAIQSGNIITELTQETQKEAINLFLTLSDSNTTETDSLALKVIHIARTFVGKPYVYGGKHPTKGFDCSGLVGYVYKQIGIDIPFSTSGLFLIKNTVKLDNIQIGDIICTPGTGPSKRHVKLVSKIENGLIYVIEAKGKKWGIVEEPLSKTNNIISIKRVL